MLKFSIHSDLACITKCSELVCVYNTYAEDAVEVLNECVPRRFAGLNMNYFNMTLRVPVRRRCEIDQVRYHGGCAVAPDGSAGAAQHADYAFSRRGRIQLNPQSFAVLVFQIFQLEKDSAVYKAVAQKVQRPGLIYRVRCTNGCGARVGPRLRGFQRTSRPNSRLISLL